MPPVEPLIDWILQWAEKRGIVNDENREEKRAQVIDNLGQENQRQVHKASLYAWDAPFSQQEERDAISRSMWKEGNADTQPIHIRR